MAIFGADTAAIIGGIGAAATAAGGVASGIMQNQAAGSRAQQATYAGWLMQEQDQAYEASQAAMARDWTSNQSDITRSFNAEQAREARDVSVSSQREAQDWSSQQAAVQRDWQERMSGTAYQRSVADMRAAGLNPILGVASGGASTPSGAMPTAGMASAPVASATTPGGPSAHASMARPEMAETAAVIGPALSSALQAMKIFQDISTAQTGIEKTKADTANVQAQTNTEGIKQGVLAKQGPLTEAQTNEALARTTAAAGIPALQRAQTSEALAKAGEAQAGVGTAAAQQRYLDTQSDVLGRTYGGHVAEEVTGAVAALKGFVQDLFGGGSTRTPVLPNIIGGAGQGGSRPVIDVGSSPNAIPQ